MIKQFLKKATGDESKQLKMELGPQKMQSVGNTLTPQQNSGGTSYSLKLGNPSQTTKPSETIIVAKESLEPIDPS